MCAISLSIAHIFYQTSKCYTIGSVYNCLQLLGASGSESVKSFSLMCFLFKFDVHFIWLIFVWLVDVEKANRY